MNRAEQLTRELYMVHKTGEHSVSYAVARIMALEELLRDVLADHADGVIALEPDRLESIEELVPDEDTFDNDDPDSTMPTDEESLDADE